MLQIEGLTSIGQVAVFYIPVDKLDQTRYSKLIVHKFCTPREIIHKFLMEQYDAYTLEISDTKGFWRNQKRSKIFVDQNARYEVSFAGKEKIPSFIAFLLELCELLEEEAIYLTMGQCSYLVERKVQ